MEEKVYWPDEISDDMIIKEFVKAEVIDFEARNFNFISLAIITFGDSVLTISLIRLLPLIGITTPQTLRPVVASFYPELPEVINDYEQLPSFRTVEAPFVELAKILKKSINVFWHDGRFNYHYCFSVTPAGIATKSEPL